MNVTKEILESLGVVSMSLSCGANDYVCFLKKVSCGVLSFSLLSPPDFQSNIKLKISLKNGDELTTCHADFIANDSGENYCTGVISGKQNERITELLKKISSLEYQDEKYGRRKEERIPIGRANYERFGLRSPEQTLFVKGIKFIQPCAVVDVSLHGICVITPYKTFEKKGIENFNIKLSFKNPDETIILQAHKVHERLNRTDTNVFSTLSCQLLEPISYSWKNRVIKILESADEFST